jgi:hypothetical protein
MITQKLHKTIITNFTKIKNKNTSFTKLKTLCSSLKSVDKHCGHKGFQREKNFVEAIFEV